MLSLLMHYGQMLTMIMRSDWNQMNAFNDYKRLLSTNGMWKASAASFIAHLRCGIIPIALNLAIAHYYDNWALVGIISAVYVIGVAIASPLYARLFERSERIPGIIAVSFQSIISILLILCLGFKWHVIILAIISFMIGFTQYPTGSIIRTRWSMAVSNECIPIAYSWESVLDDMVFVISPAIAAVLSTMLNPLIPFIIMMACDMIGGYALFIVKYDVHVNMRTMNTDNINETINHRNIIGIMIALLAFYIMVNAAWAAFDLSMTSYLTDMRSMPAMTGLLIALASIGSLIGGLVYGVIKWKPLGWNGLLIFQSIMIIGYVIMYACSFAPVWLLLLVAAPCSFAYTPSATIMNLKVMDTVPRQRLTEGLAWTATALQIGSALGSSITGQVVQNIGPRAGILLSVIFTAIIVIIAIIMRKLDKRKNIWFE